MLKRVKIQGYKSLEDVEVHLQPLSVFFGPNASGKSNFLDALQLLSRMVNSRTLKDAFTSPYRGTPLESFTFGPNGIKDIVAKGKASFSFQVDIELSQATIDDLDNQLQVSSEGNQLMNSMVERNLRYCLEVEILPKKGILHVVKEKLIAINPVEPDYSRVLLEHEKGKNSSRWYAEGREYTSQDTYLDHCFIARPYFSHPSPHLIAVRQELANWFFYYLEPRERMRSSTAVKEVNHLGLMGEEIDAFLNTLSSLDHRQFEAVEKALHLILPGITGINVEVNDLGYVELRLLEGQTPMPLHVLSEGTLRILGLLALGSAKNAPLLLGCEEPENGIYPDRLDLIALLLKTLSYNGTQVIVTTHSPILIDAMDATSLYVCRKVNKHTLIEPFSVWQYPDAKSHDEGETDLPELTTSERLRRGDFSV